MPEISDEYLPFAIYLKKEKSNPYWVDLLLKNWMILLGSSQNLERIVPEYIP